VAGRVRMVADGVPERMDDSPAQDVQRWQGLVEGQGEVTVPAGATQTILWDLEDYVCGYPVLETAWGKGARVAIEWAEACFDDESRKTKSDRSAITGNYFEGYGDTFVAHGGDMCLRSFWWRAGRYLRITVTAADEELLIRRLAIEESRLPLSNESRFASDDPELDAIIPLTVRGIQMCAHETYMDCPYYEQMMYVGDARLQLLTTCVMSHEDRLHQRCLELLDWSRHVTDFVLMRHPSDPRQLSTTFSMVWIMMIRDLAWWRRDAAFIKGLLPGMRAQLEQFRALADERMLLTGLPGWSFIDWVNADGWEFARPPAGERGTSGICNLLFLLALQSAIDIEDAYGEQHFADNYRAWSAALAGSVQDMFWDVERGAFADDPGHRCFSEHAQCLALLSGQFDRHVEDDAFAFLTCASGLARTSVYFSFYLLEVFYRQGRGDSIIAKMDFWKELVRSGFKAPVEQPEPSRSDCHAWGSHPLFHMHASLAGIRPAAAGFAKVRVAPQPGTLRCLSCRTPHPDGFIELAMTLEAREWHVALSLPAGVPGEFVWQGVAREVTGDCTFTVPVAG
jgi:alpha-L-rhamnosidase